MYKTIISIYLLGAFLNLGLCQYPPNGFARPYAPRFSYKTEEGFNRYKRQVFSSWFLSHPPMTLGGNSFSQNGANTGVPSLGDLISIALQSINGGSQNGYPQGSPGNQNIQPYQPGGSGISPYQPGGSGISPYQPGGYGNPYQSYGQPQYTNTGYGQNQYQGNQQNQGFAGSINGQFTAPYLSPYNSQSLDINGQFGTTTAAPSGPFAWLGARLRGFTQPSTRSARDVSGRSKRDVESGRKDAEGIRSDTDVESSRNKRKVETIKVPDENHLGMKKIFIRLYKKD